MSGYETLFNWQNGRDPTHPRINAQNIRDEFDHMGDYVEGLAGGSLAIVSPGTVTTNQTLDMTNFQEVIWAVTLGATDLKLEISSWSPGKSVTLIVKQDATGSRVLLSLPTAKWEGGAIPVGSTAANAIDIRAFFRGVTETFGFESGTGMA